MAWWDRLKRTLRGGEHAAEIDEELQFHLQMDMAQGHEGGEARKRMGNLGMIEEDTRAAGVVVWLDSVLQDLRYGMRQLRKAPGLAAAVICSLAVGVGANTAIFSLMDAAILRPLPVRNPALGAGAGDILRLVLRDSMWMVGGGIALGVPGIYAVGKLIGSANILDAGTVAISIASVVAVAIVAGWAPALRAARIDPVTTLREG